MKVGTIKGALGTTMHAMKYVVPRVWGGGYISLPINLEHEESLCSTVHTQSRAASYEQAAKASKEAENQTNASTHTCTARLAIKRIPCTRGRPSMYIRSIVSFPDPGSQTQPRAS